MFLLLTRMVGRRIVLSLTLLVFLLTTGTIAFVLIEKMNFWDALYMTVITISTVGYKEVKELSHYGKIFTMFLILTGVGVLFYTLGTSIEYFFGDFIEIGIQERRIRKMISRLKDHFIICGYGRVGEQVALEMKKLKAPFLIIDNSEKRVEAAKKENFLVIKGNATDEEILKEANIEKAKGLAAVVGNDADNVFIVLTARSLSPEIFIVARSNTLEDENKLYRAGADRVLSPAVFGGRKIASLLVKPGVSEYIDALSFGEMLEFQIEEYQVPKSSPLVGKTLKESKVRDLTGAVVIAISYPDGNVETIPRATTSVDADSKLIVLGTPEQLEKFEKKFIET